MDTAPLRTSVDFRRLFIGRSVTLIGSAITEVALLIQVKQITGSPLAVGLIGVAQVVPVVIFSLYGGALADRLDRKKLALWCEVALGVITLLLTLNALLRHPILWFLYVAAALIISLTVLQRPSLDSAVPRIVSDDQFSAASALLSIASNSSTILGPALSGLLVAGPGAKYAYGLDTLSYLISLLLLARLRSLPRMQADEEDEPSPTLASIWQGLRYAVGRRDLLGSYLVDLSAMTFAYPVALFPFVAAELHAQWAQGLLFSAEAVGALLLSVTSAWTGRIRRQGRAIALAGAAWGVSIIGFGLSGNIALALFFLVLAGGADTLSGIFRDTMWNKSIPGSVRGRMAGVEVLSYGTGPVLGQIRGGAVAQGFGVPVSLWSGGAACIVAIGLTCVSLPQLLSYDARSPQQPENSAAEVEDRASPR
jgi:MFS family permease